MNMGIVEFVLLISLAIFTLLGTRATELISEKKYRKFWGTLFWAMLFLALPIILWTTSHDYSMLIKLIAFGVAGAVLGATSFVWLGYKFLTISPTQTVSESRPEPDPPKPSKNSPNISAGGNVTIGNMHIGDTINNGPPSPTRKHPPDERLPGFAAGWRIKVNDITEVRKKYQFAYKDPEGAKADFHLSAGNRYVFTVTDIHGSQYDLSIPLGSDGIPFSEYAYVFFVVGTASNYSYLRALVNGEEVARRDLDFPIDLGSRNWLGPMIGSDSEGNYPGSLSLTEILTFKVTPTDPEMMRIVTESRNYYSTPLPDKLTDLPPYKPK